MAVLDPTRDIVQLTADLCDIASESLDEAEIADAVEAVLLAAPHLTVVRDGHTLVARTDLGRAERVVIAGHLDTVPANDNFPTRLDGDTLWGLGTCDMKGGVAVALQLAATVAEPVRDVTYVFYEAEEIAARFNGLGRLARERPELLAGDFAILMEPSVASVEAGCQGTIRVDVVTRGERAHAARSWTGHNAIHDAAEVLVRLRDYEPRRVVIDGLEYRDGLNAVGISGGVAGNVVPDLATVTVNYRFAPDRSEDDALAHLREVFDGFELTVTDSAPGALPGLDQPAAAAFVETLGAEPRPKFGWTDVAQFTQLGIPAVNYGPGDPIYAHKQDEHVPVAHLRSVEDALRRWLTA
ncbi:MULTISPECIES: succinyl-diaminopimelate desuccinylase [unclassified Aeromicrobium]|uniref:succinyl-diaminopimelate desuccinylase n=1 Tax=unclassified Aeromicrobium TaxID=2633570 RepID=UPI0020984FEC|nr:MULTISPECIES: succinyl-diaminopimelate desuccinylase [unclassified Aeromicrobium]MCO7239361.1 succinyl-diaminopimelate desuccinylase [Aeromicrobium sp. CnD17-E]MDR6120191.1 succinyl-diaminopimelate desuccinylase [Aeromicrobium sp. SORGH_AS_0981]